MLEVCQEYATENKFGGRFYNKEIQQHKINPILLFLLFKSYLEKQRYT